MLKINQKGYICNLLEAKGISLYHLIVFLMKAYSALFFDQVGDHIQVDLNN